MNTLISTLNNMGDAYAIWLWHSAWQGAVVGGIMLLVVRYARRIPVNLQYALLLLAFFKFIVPPTYSLPIGLFSQIDSRLVSTSSWFPEPDDEMLLGTAFRVPASRFPFEDLVPLNIKSVTLESSADLDAKATPVLPNASSAEAQNSKSSSNKVSTSLITSSRSRISPHGWIAVIHVLGIAGVTFWVMLHVVRLFRLHRRSAIVKDGQSLSQLQALALSLGVSSKTQLRHCDLITGPIVYGTWRSTILLPTTLLSANKGDMEAMLLHELAHIRRRDLFVIWLQLPVLAIWWFHPMVWLLHRKIVSVREDCCDDLTVATGASSEIAYCEALLRVARVAASERNLLACGIADGHPLARRIRRLMDSQHQRATRLSIAGAIVVFACAAVVLPGLRTSTDRVQAQQVETSNRSNSSNTVVGSASTIESSVDNIQSRSMPIGRIGQSNSQNTWGFARGFTANGQHLITASRGAAVMLWNMESQQCDWKLSPNEQQECLAISGNGRLLALQHQTADIEYALTVYDLIQRRTLWTKVFRRSVIGSFSPDGAILAVKQDNAQAIRLIETDSGVEVGAIQMGMQIQQQAGIRFSKGGRYLAAVSNRNEVAIWDLFSGTLSTLPKGANPRTTESIDFVSDDLILIGTRSLGESVAKSTSTFQVWNTLTKEVTFELPLDVSLSTGRVRSTLSSDGTTLVTAHKDRLIVWDIANRMRRSELVFQEDDALTLAIGLIVISPDNRVLVANRGNKLLMWDATTGKDLGQENTNHTGLVTDVTLSPDDSLIATSGEDGKVFLWDALTGKRLRPLIQSNLPISSVAFLADGEQLVASGEFADNEKHSIHGIVEIVNVSDAKRIRRWDLPGRENGMGVSPEANLLAMASGPNSSPFGRGGNGNANEEPAQIQIWNLKHETMETKLDGYQGERNGKIVFAKDSNTLAYSSRTGLTIWQRDNASPKLTPNLQDVISKYISNSQQRATTFVSELNIDKGYAYNSLSVHSRMEDRLNLVVCSDVKSSKVVWDKKYEVELPRHLTLSPDGRVLAIGIGGGQSMESKRLVVVDAATGRDLQSIDSDELNVTAVRFSRDGRRIYTGRSQGDVLVWDVSAAYQALGDLK